MRYLGVVLAVTTATYAHADPQSRMLRDAPAVSPVLTEHTAGLRCLGGLIDQSAGSPVRVAIREIDDTTVPLLNEERRLSLGGSFVLHTAISRLETDKVQSFIDENRGGPQRLTLSGAWTQDDFFANQGGIGVRFRTGNVSAGIGRRKSYDFIAGDFASSVNGRVLLSTAVGVALPRRGNEAFLIVDDGADGAEIGIDRRRVLGAQMAQRRVLEAVALIHLAHHFRIDYRPCLESSYAGPEAFTGALNRFEKMSDNDQNRAMQTELARHGHLAAAGVTGRWDAASRIALNAFQIARRLPASGRPSPVLYALLVTTAAPRKK